VCDAAGEALTQKAYSVWSVEPQVGRMCELVRMCLRHAFCSHLAMRRAPAKAFQELAGHQDLTTQQYMRVSPAALDAAIGLLDSGQTSNVGNIWRRRDIRREAARHQPTVACQP